MNMKNKSPVLNTLAGVIRPNLRLNEVWRFLNAGKIDASRLPLTILVSSSGVAIQDQMDRDLEKEEKRLVSLYYQLDPGCRINGRTYERSLMVNALKWEEQDDINEAVRDFMRGEAEADMDDFHNGVDARDFNDAEGAC